MKRIKEIDALKGVLILLVVLGHSGIKNTNIVYWFHMPAFFLISGFLFNRTNLDLPIHKNFITKKILNLIIPYISYLLLIILISLTFQAGSMEIHNKDFIFKALWGGKLLYGQFGTFWFVTCLLFTIVGYSIIYKLIKSEVYRLLLVATLFLLGHFESFLIYRYGCSIIIPLNIDVSLISLCYFYLGTIVQKHLNKIQDYLNKIQNKKYFILSISFLSISLFILFFSKYNMDLKYQLYLNPFFTFFVPIIFTTLIFFFVKIINHLPIISFFEIIGKHSMSIMFLHLIIKDFLIKFDIYSIWLFSILGCILPVVFSLIFNNYKITRLVFAGSVQEFNFLKKLST